MRNQPHSRQTLRQLTVLGLMFSFLFTPLIGMRRTYAIPEGETDPVAAANTALAKADGAFRRATDLGERADARLAELKEFTTFKQPDVNSLRNINRLVQTISLMFDDTAEPKTLPKQLLVAQTNLGKALDDVNTAKGKLDSAPDDTPNLAITKTRVNKSITALKAKVDTPELNGLSAQLTDALAKVYPAVAKVAKDANSRLEPFTRNITEPTDLFAVFRKDFANVPPTIQFYVDLKDSWPKLATQLENVVDDHKTKVTQVNDAVGALDTSVKTVAGKIDSQLDTLLKFAKTLQGALDADKGVFAAAPARHEKEAVEDIRDARLAIEALEKINRSVDSIAKLAESAGIAEFKRDETKAAQTKLTASLVEVRGVASSYQDLLSGDRSLWVTEKIRLYYFTDIPRLVQTLNPDATMIGGDPDARRRAKDSLEKLRAAEDAQSEAAGMVASLRNSVRTIQQQLDEANAQAEAANQVARETSRRDAELNRRPAGDVSDEAKARSREKKDKAEEDRAAAQARADKLNDDKNGLAAQLREAKAQLETASAALERATNATLREAQRDSTAFAEARDNAPFWYSPGVATSNDPAKRVEITSSTGGENAIFVRGRREDVIKVQDIVAKLDEPAPQARMTLWKIELNSDATEKGAEKFNRGLEIVEEEIASTRAKIADALSFLLRSVSEEAERAAAKKREDDAVAAKSNPVDFEDRRRKDCHEKDIYARYFKPDSTSTTISANGTNGTNGNGHANGANGNGNGGSNGTNGGSNGTNEDRKFVSTELTDITGRYQRLGRYSLYSPQVRKELGIEFIDELGFDNPKQFGLKDPGSATTLNEALIIMLLTNPYHRDQIMTRFRQGLATLEPNKNDKEEQPIEFKRFDAAMLDSSFGVNQDQQTTRQQQELIYAMRGPLLRHLVGRLTRLQDRVNEFTAMYAKSEEAKKIGAFNQSELYGCLKAKLPKIFDTIHDEFPISPVDILQDRVEIFDPGDGTIGLRLFDDNRQLLGSRIYSLRPSPARVAAADGMLDVFTKAFEDDIDRNFVQPMLKNLRLRLRKTGIGFGVIQRTSVLATNRMVARVDPRATAELSVGQETNLIQGLQSIAQLALSAQQGNVLGGLSQLKSLTASEKDTAEIYGITSGSAFQVTPIFDPTGQALRFKFDFVDATLVREPRGTVNARIPRIERHSVNTEVQLANLEIREVSRFESDAKIGIPTTYRGGLPLLRDLPGVRPIPLIGWFIRRKGSNAIAQRSLIFAQTTMSPTIGDILDLFDTSLQRR